MQDKLKTIIIGNGLGMALNPQAFDLKTGLKIAADKLKKSDSEQYVFLEQLFKSLQIQFPPIEEDELAKIQKVLNGLTTIQSTCSEISQLFNDTDAFCLIFENENFNKKISSFQSSFNTYIFYVADYFHEQSMSLDADKQALLDGFIKRLVNYIVNGKEKGRCHLFTTNYDSLLYKSFWPDELEKIFRNENKEFINKVKCLLNGYYNTYFVDGFWVKHQDDQGFSADHLTSKHDNKFGYYFHLHGSPLFYEREEIINKFKIEEYNKEQLSERTHIVLTDIENKSSLIDKSLLLRTYFKYFNSVLKNSETVFLFGYSGNDEHINQALKASGKKKFIIIEKRLENYTEENRKKFWHDALAISHSNNILRVLLRDNILKRE